MGKFEENLKKVNANLIKLKSHYEELNRNNPFSGQKP